MGFFAASPQMAPPPLLATADLSLVRSDTNSPASLHRHNSIPVKALSIRQPWVWFIFEPPPKIRKPVENRTWPAPRELIGHWILLHAAKGGTHKEWDEACAFAAKCGVTMFPQFDTVERGGIVGSVRLTACVRKFDSSWFVGPFGHVFSDPYPMRFAPLVGQQGYFDAIYDPPRGV